MLKFDFSFSEETRLYTERLGIFQGCCILNLIAGEGVLNNHFFETNMQSFGSIACSQVRKLLVEIMNSSFRNCNCQVEKLCEIHGRIFPSTIAL